MPHVHVVVDHTLPTQMRKIKNVKDLAMTLLISVFHLSSLWCLSKTS